MKTTYVYLIQKGYGSIKIGVSNNPEKRCQELQTGNHGSLFLIAKFPFSNRFEAMAMEKELHLKFNDYRLNGEWFKKGILRRFQKRSELLPHIFKEQNSGKFNSYHTI